MSARSELPHKNLSLPSRDSVTAYQVSTLLGIVNTLGAYLANTRAVEEIVPTKGAQDGGSRMAVENSLIRVCERIDGLVEDSSRWNMDFQNTLEKQLLVAYDENVIALRLASQVAKSQLAPSTRFKPALIFLPGLGWCAVLGDMNVLEHCVIGYGATPEQAMLSFDVNFEAGPPDAAAILAAVREKAFAEGTEAPGAMILPTKPKTRKKK